MTTVIKTTRIPVAGKSGLIWVQKEAELRSSLEKYETDFLPLFGKLTVVTHL